MLQTFRLCRFQARYQILQTQNHESDMGKKVPPKMWIPKYAWNENKKEDYLTRGIFSILFFGGHCE